MTGTGAITAYWDVASVVFTLFILFFIGLVVHLTLESKREGFPLETERFGTIKNEGGILGMPSSKIFKTEFGKTYEAPLATPPAPEVLNAVPAHHINGAPLVPVGNPLLAGVGPGSYANRADVPDVGLHGEPRILPLRKLPSFSVLKGDKNPIGMQVYGADDHSAGVISDVWIDHMESMIRYLEIQLAGGGHVLMPMNFAKIHTNRVSVKAILAAQFKQVPVIKNPEQITLLEEEKIMAYFGAGTLYATPQRQEPVA